MPTVRGHKVHGASVSGRNLAGDSELTLSNLPTEAIMLQSGETLQQLIQSLWPESTCTRLPSTQEGGSNECLLLLCVLLITKEM